jgi:hypothetical protein
MTRLLGWLVIAGLAAGCGSPGGSTSSDTRPSGVAASAPSASAAAPSLDPAWLAARAVTCDDKLFFSPALLQGPGEEQVGVDVPAQILREYLQTPGEETDRATTGWHRVVQTATNVQFVAVRPSGRGLMTVGVNFARGSWQLGDSGSCAATVQRPAGLARADWWLDPDQPAPAPSGRVVQGLLLERACTGGKPPVGRVQAPAIDYLDGAVVVTMSVRPLPGGHDCPGNPDFPFMIRLDQPLGDRRLLDGGVFPPRDASIKPD